MSFFLQKTVGFFVSNKTGFECIFIQLIMQEIPKMSN
jgi:hypothetical protein